MNYMCGSCACPVSLLKLSKAFQCKYVQIGTGLVGAGLVAMKVKALVSARALATDRASFKKDVVYLYSFPRCGEFNIISPGSSKVEIFLRLAKLPYVNITSMDAEMSPTGRLPCISYNGEIIPDSQVIVEALTEKLSLKLDAELTPAQKTEANLMRTALEKSAWIHVERLGIVEHGRVTLPVMLKSIGFSNITVPLMTKMFRGQIIKFLNAHGNGDVPAMQCDKELTGLLASLESCIEKNGGFAVSEKPTSVDAVVYATLLQVRGYTNIAGPGACKSFAFFQNSEVLKTYCSKMDSTIYADMASLKMTEGRQEFV